MTFLRQRGPKISKAEFRLRYALTQQNIRFFSQEVVKCKNRRQYCVDFLLLEKQVIIEVDGAIHDFQTQQLKDDKKTKDLQDEGYTVLRFRDGEIWHNLNAVIKVIKQTLKQKPALIH